MIGGKIMYDIIIVGAGTAGLSAAIYSLRAGKNILLIESNTYGGQIITSPEVDNYPGIKHISGFAFAQNLYEQVADLGGKIIYEKVIGIKVNDNDKCVITDKKEYPCKSIILATGAKKRPLGLEREKELIGAGISYCATCDGAFFKGKDVAVVGGGNTALEDVGFLAGYCNKVYLIHRRDSFRGEEKLVDKLHQKTNVEIILNSQVEKIIGEKKVEGIVLKNRVDQTANELKVNGLFIAIGQMPENDAFANVIELDKTGYIKASEDCKTNIAGVFTAGDCRTKTIRQLATAAADGAVAALAACEYIA